MTERQLRRAFEMPEADSDFLRRCECPWETVIEGEVRRLILYDFAVPEGYGVPLVTLNLRIERGYPDNQLDMVYFLPELTRRDGKGIAAVAGDQFDGKTWQRWSRHRTAENPWRPGIDNVETHLLLVTEWLKREFGK